MALSEKYTNNTFAYNDGPTTNGITFIVSDTINNLYPKGSIFDNTVLLSNGSTSDILNQGSFDTQYLVYHGEAYTEAKSNEEGLMPIEYLGACVTIDIEPTINYFCLTDHETDRYFNGGETNHWDRVQNGRFILSTIPNKSTSGRISPFTWAELPDDRYDFNGAVIVPNYHYTTYMNSWAPSSLEKTTYDYTQVEPPAEYANSGDPTKQFLSTTYRTMFTNYNKDMDDGVSLTKAYVGLVWFVFNINGKIYFIRQPENTPVRSVVHNNYYIEDAPGVTKKITIGNMLLPEAPTDPDADTDTYVLPPDDETKGYSFFFSSVSQQSRSVSNFFITNLAAAYLVNSIGLRWINKPDADASITTAKTFRNNVRLGLMGSNGVINHKVWFMNEEEIQESENPNKNTSYDAIPERGSGGNPDQNRDLTLNDVLDKMPSVNWTSFGHYYLLNADTMGDVISFVSRQASDSLYNKILNVHASFIGITGNTPESQIKIGGTPVTKENGDPVKAKEVTVAVRYLKVGSFDIKQYYKDFRDYLTQYEIYLPLVGWVNISSVVTLGHVIKIELAVDVINGDAQYKLQDKTTGAYIETIPCSFGFDIPVTSNGNGQMKIARANLIASTLASAVQGGLGAGAMFTSNDEGSTSKYLSGAGSVVGTVGGFIHNANNIKVLKSTSFANATGVAPYAMIQSACSPTVILRITRVEDYIPEGYGHTTGFVCDKVVTLSEMSGFTVCDNVDCSGIVCTDTEKAMIKTMLESGVYL